MVKNQLLGWWYSNENRKYNAKIVKTEDWNSLITKYLGKINNNRTILLSFSSDLSNLCLFDVKFWHVVISLWFLNMSSIFETFIKCAEFMSNDRYSPNMFMYMSGNTINRWLNLVKRCFTWNHKPESNTRPISHFFSW